MRRNERRAVAARVACGLGSTARCAHAPATYHPRLELAEVQKAPSVFRLNEPNVVEVIQKLSDLGLLSVLHPWSKQVEDVRLDDVKAELA